MISTCIFLRIIHGRWFRVVSSESWEVGKLGSLGSRFLAQHLWRLRCSLFAKGVSLTLTWYMKSRE